MKKNKGITLVALVITVVILLILAGITINSLMGSDGLLGRASSAVDENEIAAAKENVILYVSECKIDYITDNKTGDFVDYLRNKVEKEQN